MASKPISQLLCFATVEGGRWPYIWGGHPRSSYATRLNAAEVPPKVCGPGRILRQDSVDLSVIPPVPGTSLEAKVKVCAGFLDAVEVVGHLTAVFPSGRA